MDRAFASDSAAARACETSVLDVSRVAGVSTVTRAYAAYPVKTLTPKCARSDDCDCAWAYVVNMGGGLVSGDASGTRARVEDGCALVLVTQGTQKVYKHNRRRWEDMGAGDAPGVDGERVGETVSALYASVGQDALFASLPDPTQVFANAVFRQTQAIDVRAGGSCVCVDWLTSGRVGYGNERWLFERAETRTRVTVDDKPVVVEAVRLRSSSSAEGAMVNGNRSLAEKMGAVNVFATLIVLGPRVETLAKSCAEWARARARECMRGRGAAWVLEPPESVKDDPTCIFVTASELEEEIHGANGVVVRFFAANTECVYDALREILAPLESDIGAPPYAERGLS